MRKYEKIDTLYIRDTTGTKKLIEGKFRDPTVEFLAPCEWIWTEKVDGCLGIKVVPIIGSGSLFDAAEYVKIPRKSMVAEGRCDMEGLVCRPKMEMRDRRGNRLIVKVKYCDMKELV